MTIVDDAGAPLRRAPLPGGPTVRPPRRHQHDLRPGTATHIGVGERQHPNPGADHAELLVLAAPPDFA